MNKHKLIKELRRTGSASSESEALADLAGQLAKFSPPGLSKKTKQTLLKEIAVEPRRIYPLRWAVAGSFAVLLLAATILTQNFIPNRNQENGDNIRVMESSEEIETLLKEQISELEELKQQETVDEVQLEEAEKRLENTRERYRRSQNRKREHGNWWQNLRSSNNSERNERRRD